MAKKYIVLCQEYIESEAGWGQRPDSAAIAVSKEALEEYKKSIGSFGEYGNPYLVLVDKELYNKCVEKKCIRISESEFEKFDDNASDYLIGKSINSLPKKAESPKPQEKPERPQK